jgi:hypothetical protein
MLILLARSNNLLYLPIIFASAPHAATVRMPVRVSATTLDASLSTSCTAAYLFTIRGVVIEYHAMTKTSPVAVTKVNAQLYMHPMTKATRTIAVACSKDESLSEMPSCSMFAVIVMIAVVCPEGKASSVEIGCWNSAWR